MNPPAWDLQSLRTLLGEDAKPLGYDATASYAFLAADVHGVRRYVVVWKQALVSFDVVPPGLEPPAPLDLGARPLLRTVRKTVVGTLLLNVAQFEGAPLQVGEVSSVEMAGVRVTERVMVFHADIMSARGAVSYSMEGPEKLKHLVVGLAPGLWQIWWNGWLEDPGLPVPRQAGALFFEGAGGNYFLRRLD